MTYHITTPMQLQAMNSDLTGDYILDNDLDMTGFSWTPIGGFGSSSFKGTFDGQGHTIGNLTYDDTIPNLGAASLFVYLYPGDGSPNTVTIQNLNLKNFNFTGHVYVAGVCGIAVGAVQILNVHVSDIILTATNTYSYGFGGISGEIDGVSGKVFSIANSDVTNITINCFGDDNGYGGFLGNSFLDTDNVITEINISNCFAKNVNIIGVDATGISEVGGFIGYAEGTISQCYASGTIVAVNNDIGGFIGNSDTLSINNCYSNVNITGDTGSSNVIGGFIGGIISPLMTILNCYAQGTITGDSNSSNLAGFIGGAQLSHSSDSIQITNCYSVGVVSPNVGDNTTQNGGFIGFIQIHNFPVGISVSNCSWYTGSFVYAIGENQNLDTSTNLFNKSLTYYSWGTDESNNTKFYSKTHPVYAQGGSNPWEFYN